MSDGIYLVITSAVVIDGEIAKVGELVEVSEREAKNLLHRGKARLATEADGIPADDEPEQPKPGKSKGKSPVAEATETDKEE